MASQEKPFDHWQFTNLKLSQQSHGLSIILTVTIVTVLFLAAFLYWYHHYTLSRSHYISNTSATNSTTTFRPGNDVVQGIPMGLDSATIDAIPIFLHPSIPDVANEETECSICLGLFLDEEIIKVLPKCHHAYHSACVDKWLRTRSSCPLCRASLAIEGSNEFVVIHL